MRGSSDEEPDNFDDFFSKPHFFTIIEIGPASRGIQIKSIQGNDNLFSRLFKPEIEVNLVSVNSETSYSSRNEIEDIIPGIYNFEALYNGKALLKINGMNTLPGARLELFSKHERDRQLFRKAVASTPLSHRMVAFVSGLPVYEIPYKFFRMK